jgi:hypothetical protein
VFSDDVVNCPLLLLSNVNFFYINAYTYNVIGQMTGEGKVTGDDLYVVHACGLDRFLQMVSIFASVFRTKVRIRRYGLMI